MLVRKSLALGAAAVVAGSTLLLTATPASAAYHSDPDDTTFTAVSADLVGVGSDTTQHAIKLVADAWNADSSHTFKLATYAATEGGAAQQPGATIPIPGGETSRPNGSGAGKGRLYGIANVPEVDFARSSDGLSTAETDNGLKAFPFALDTVVVAVSNVKASHAPVSITVADLVNIYECKDGATNWSSFGGTAGVIKPQVPQSGSGTAKFFKKQLDTAKGSAVTYGGCVDQTVQEHDDTTVRSNVDAIVPISKGRAALKGTTVRILKGFAADRALYNVVRGSDQTSTKVQAVFGSSGFICSPAARDLIASAGFLQLATPANDGACGTAVDSTSNFTVNASVATKTTLAATVTGRSVKLVAKITGSSAPSGTVDFFEGTKLLKAGAPLVSGQATFTKTGVTLGKHSYKAVFKPATTTYVTSTGTVSATVKSAATLTESFPAAVAKGKRATGTVKAVGGTTKPTGKVSIVERRKTIATVTLKAGAGKVTLPKLAKGKHTLKLVYKGDANTLASSKAFTITQR